MTKRRATAATVSVFFLMLAQPIDIEGWGSQSSRSSMIVPIERLAAAKLMGWTMPQVTQVQRRSWTA